MNHFLEKKLSHVGKRGEIQKRTRLFIRNHAWPYTCEWDVNMYLFVILIRVLKRTISLQRYIHDTEYINVNFDTCILIRSRNNIVTKC
jgi:hypothetical protein